MKDSEIYDLCLEKWGLESQYNMLIEELAELIQAIIKLRRKGDTITAFYNFAEEITDVEFMIDEFKHFFGKPLTDNIKLYRTKKKKRLMALLEQDGG